MFEHKERSLPDSAREKEKIKLRIVAVPAFGADRGELMIDAQKRTYGPNKILVYEAIRKHRELAEEGKPAVKFADNIVGLPKYSETDPVYYATKESGREYESTLYWADELKTFVKSLNLLQDEVEIIVEAQPDHQARCLKDLQAVGFNNIMLDDAPNKVAKKYGSQVFFDLSSAHWQTKTRTLMLLWETAIKLARKFPGGEGVYRESALGKKEI